MTVYKYPVPGRRLTAYYMTGLLKPDCRLNPEIMKSHPPRLTQPFPFMRAMQSGIQLLQAGR